ncbi:MAG TPA: hypothetical protein PKV72_05945 [Candidatus Peribacteria bacterium]|nr:hypothetical protein [Candidatus Peribacteria bacterium]
MGGYRPLSASDAHDATDPNDVAEAAESAVELDDVRADLLREVAMIRQLLADDPEGTLIPVDYSARMRILALADERRDMTA